MKERKQTIRFHEVSRKGKTPRRDKLANQRISKSLSVKKNLLAIASEEQTRRFNGSQRSLTLRARRLKFVSLLARGKPFPCMS